MIVSRNKIERNSATWTQEKAELVMKVCKVVLKAEVTNIEENLIENDFSIVNGERMLVWERTL